MDYFEYSDQAFALTDFLPRERCQELIERTEAEGYEEAPINTGSGFVVAPEIRNNTRVIIDDKALAKELWVLCEPYIPKRIKDWTAHSLNERFRFYRYENYQAFRWHSDGNFRRYRGEESKLTFMVYLNADFEGGFTDFRDFKVWPVEGMALCFHHPLIHEGASVSRGRKYVLRTDVMYRNSV